MNASKNLSGKIYVTLILAVCLFFGGRYFVFWKIKGAIVNKFEELHSEGISIHYSSINVNSWNGGVIVKDLVAEQHESDSICSSSSAIEELTVKGISILPLLINKKLSIKSIVLTKPSIQYIKRSRNLNRKPDSGGKALKELVIDLIQIDSGKFEMIDSSLCGVTFRANLNSKLKNLEIINLGSDSLLWKMESIIAKGIAIDLPKSFYHLTIDQFFFSQKDKFIQVDSIKLIPTLDRREFARQSGRQIDQFTFSLSSLNINQFEMVQSIRPSYTAREIGLDFKLKVYRDKRFPRTKRETTILPVDFLHKLPFSLHVDSLLVKSSEIIYEEHPEKGTDVGKISFHDLNAGIYNISNDSTGESVMKVHARFMNAGDLNAYFTFPLEKHKLYGVKGSLVNFEMPSLNTMLEPVAHIKIESGKIQAMEFDFRYDNQKSNGELELRYTDLKVLAIKDDQDKSTNKIVTLIIGALVKKSINKNDPKDKRTGAIAFERDSQKAVFNYWWKSILSGVKSVFGFGASLQKEQDKKKNTR